MRSLRFLALVLLPLAILPGCAATGFPGFFGALALVLLLTLFSACNALADLPPFNDRTVNENRFHEALLRALLRSHGSSASYAGCAARDYTRSFDLSTVDPATAGFGFTITGQNAADRLGNSVAGAGDFNGDGIGDIIVSAPDYNTNFGRVYLIYGRAGSGGDIDTATMTAGDGIRIDGSAAADYIGYRDSVSTAGDVNGDGFDDILIGSFPANSNSGRAWLIFGSAAPTDLDLSLISPTEGVRFDGAGPGRLTGQSVAAAGDMNADGFDDFLIGTGRGLNSRGEVSLIYGKSSGWADLTVNPTNISGTVGFSIEGYAGGDYLGVSVSGAGDLNGDGIQDLVAGDHYTNSYAGAAYVIYGASGTRSNIDLASYSASDGYEITGNGLGYWGRVTAGGGDFNGDGQADFALASTNVPGGEVTLLYGDVGALTLPPGSGTGSTLTGASGDSAGSSISMKGDVNGDGPDDLLVGAYLADNSGTNSGSVYLIFGRSDLPAAGATLSSYTGGTSGIRVDGPGNAALLGQSVDLADVNGDGCADIIAGAANGSGLDRAYVIYGGLP